jgi:hypothetical protein
MRTLRNYITSIHHENTTFIQRSELYINNRSIYLSGTGRLYYWPEYSCQNFHMFAGSSRYITYKLSDTCIIYNERDTDSSSYHEFIEHDKSGRTHISISRHLFATVRKSLNKHEPFRFYTVTSM